MSEIDDLQYLLNRVRSLEVDKQINLALIEELQEELIKTLESLCAHDPHPLNIQRLNALKRSRAGLGETK